MESKPLVIPSLYKEVLVHQSAPVKVFYSGRSAAKSHSFARAILYLGMIGRIRVVCGRQYQRSIDDSVKELLDNVITSNGLEGHYKSLRNSIAGANGTKITFIGLERSLGSIKGLEGVDIFWIEEGQYLTQQALDIILPTLRRNKGAELWVSMNVDSEDDPSYTEFVTHQRPGSIVKKTSYMENPFLDEGTIEEAMWCLKRDPQKYNNIWLGEPNSRSDKVVFKNWRIGEVKKPPDDTYFYGLDFGYATDPSALIKCWVDEDNRKLYIVDEAYGYQIEIDDLPAFIRQVPEAADNYIVADSSRPETISYLKRHDIYTTGSLKGPGSIMEGVEFIQNYDIIVAPHCKNTQYELSHYSFEVDKNTGLIKPKKPEDKDNHLMDALRYALERYRKRVKLVIYG